MINRILEMLEERRFEYEKASENPNFELPQKMYYKGVMRGYEYSKDVVQEVAKEYMHSCYDCKWECLDGCSLRRDSNGNTEPVYDGLTDCKDFEQNGE